MAAIGCLELLSEVKWCFGFKLNFVAMPRCLFAQELA